MSAQWNTASHLILLQSRLYSPGYAGPNRWVVFNAKDRRAFSAMGADVVPDVVRILSVACGGAQIDDIVQQLPEIRPEQLSGLMSAGLLIKSDGSDDADAPSALANAKRDAARPFVNHYQLASHDYPFQDYFDPAWPQQEEKLLQHYDSLWPPPSSMADREGDFHPLPPANFDDLRRGRDVEFANWISAVLRYTFGPIGEIKTKRLVCMHRTSPSGGARHPTEGAIWLRAAVGSIPAGAYIYDVKRHGLVESPGDTAILLSLHDLDCDFAIILRSHVDRAMWRYRDLRAWRPVLIDAGHIAETLSLFLTRRGLVADLISPARREAGVDWLKEPDVAVLIASRQAIPTTWRWPVESSAHWSEGETTNSEDLFLTNPALFISFRPSALRCQMVWPQRTNVELDFVGLRILSHCIPSNRGDRLSNTAGITNAVEGATSEMVASLVHAGALLKHDLASALYSQARLWARHSWYLSFLMHLEAAAVTDAPAVRSRPRARDFLEDFDALMRRRTCRKFAAATTQRDHLLTLLNRAVGPEEGGHLRAFLIALHVRDLAPMLYEYRNRDLAGVCLPVQPGREKVRQMANGQAAVENASAVVLLVARVDTDDPRRYEMDMIDLGRVGQRICLVAEELGVGVFVTPALSDEMTLKALGETDVHRLVGYLFALGKKHGG